MDLGPLKRTYLGTLRMSGGDILSVSKVSDVTEVRDDGKVEEGNVEVELEDDDDCEDDVERPTLEAASAASCVVRLLAEVITFTAARTLLSRGWQTWTGGRMTGAG